VLARGKKRKSGRHLVLLPSNSETPRALGYFGQGHETKKTPEHRCTSRTAHEERSQIRRNLKGTEEGHKQDLKINF
jgi:hypothetical protein